MPRVAFTGGTRGNNLAVREPISEVSWLPAMANPIKISSVSEFAHELSKLKITPGCIRFFRGHADYKKYDLRPTVYRKRHFIAHEKDMIEEAIIRCPADFPDSLSFFERLVRLQHYGLPTRLLDLTSNALAALYFACSSKEKTEGEVLVFDIPKAHVKYYSSDTASVIANVARLPNWFNLNDYPNDIKPFNAEEDIQRLLYDIKEDKPAFRSRIIKSDLSRVICVRAKLDNARIARQDGAFLLVGIKDHKYHPASVPSEWCVCGHDGKRIIFSSKHRMRRELEQFGISGQTLFPELASQSEAIQHKFARKYRRKKKAR